MKEDPLMKIGVKSSLFTTFGSYNKAIEISLAASLTDSLQCDNDQHHHDMGALQIILILQERAQAVSAENHYGWSQLLQVSDPTELRQLPTTLRLVSLSTAKMPQPSSPKVPARFRNGL
jgi:hypothetical protein